MNQEKMVCRAALEKGEWMVQLVHLVSQEEMDQMDSKVLLELTDVLDHQVKIYIFFN